MISIFNGASRGVNIPINSTYVQFSHELIPYLRLFGPSDWTVFCALALHMDSNGYCFPSIGTITDITGLSASTIRRSVENLCEIAIDGKPVLARNVRHDRNGRQTSNGYTLFPTMEESSGKPAPGGVNSSRGEGVKSYSDEGVKNNTLITFNKNHNESNPQVTKMPRTRRTPTLPLPNDPGRLLFEAYRSVVYPELHSEEFTLGEWTGVRHVVYQMHHKGIDPMTVENATRTLIKKWGGRRDIVTIHALWKHWSAATTGSVVERTPNAKGSTIESVTNGAIEAFRQVTGK